MWISLSIKMFAYTWSIAASAFLLIVFLTIRREGKAVVVEPNPWILHIEIAAMIAVIVVLTVFGVYTAVKWFSEKSRAKSL